MPKKSNYSMGDIREAKEQAPISKRDETIIYVVFVIVMLSLFFGTQIGNLMYVMPAIGVIVLLVTKAMSVKDTVGAMTQDAIWMAAGVLVMANALGDSGAGAIIGNFILTILGGNPNSIMVLFVFAIVTTVMTTFHVQRRHPQRADPHRRLHLPGSRLGPPGRRLHRFLLLQHRRRLPVRLSRLRHRLWCGRL